MRYPRGTPYQGPLASYDEQVSPDSFLSRAVYGRPEPLHRHGKHRDEAFYGRLLDELANAHAALVAVYTSQSSALSFAKRLRPELPAELYRVGVKDDPDYPGEWMVIAYNRVTRSLKEPEWSKPNPERRGRPRWLGSKEVAKRLGISPVQAARVMARSGVPVRRRGGRNELQVKQSDLVVLANRPGRWKRRTRKAA